MPRLDHASLLARVRACRQAGDYRRADAIARNAIAAAERALGPDSRELAVLLNERGILGKYLGRFADSERHYRRALAIYARSGEVASAFREVRSAHSQFPPGPPGIPRASKCLSRSAGWSCGKTNQSI